MNEVQENKKKRENKWIIGGSIVAILAISTPFIILWMSNKEITIKNIEGMGTVGDYLGGTTVGLLSLASIIFVVAAITMQKEELKLQREELKETRKEYHITNQTMKKQQFETTFFNMINLHHNILKEITEEGLVGRSVIQNAYEDLKRAYNTKIYESYRVAFAKEIILDQFEKTDDFVRKIFMNDNLNDFREGFYIGFVPMENEDGELDFSIADAYEESLEKGENEQWNKFKKSHIEFYEENIYSRLGQYFSMLKSFNYKTYMEDKSDFSHEYIYYFKKNFLEEPLRGLKIEAYNLIYEKYENTFGHYYRNLYRIVKLINDYDFNDESAGESEEARAQYRGILRAQLSSFELLMLFYNIVYSKKGEKFKNLLINTNFFDDHLIEKEFIWRNDTEELRELGLSNT